jgi:protoporphyrinogen oxidase
MPTAEMGKITILGGGMAGLAAGYYAKKAGFDFTVYEASNRFGGNCITLKHGDFFFDSGAHRLHDKDPEITEEMKRLLGRDLKRIKIPSQIFHHGQLIDFPLSPLNLLRKLGLLSFGRAGLEVIRGRISLWKPSSNFRDYVLKKYGKSIAEAFLLNYSAKLWGTSCDRLATAIAGERLKGLDLKTFFIEFFSGREAKTDHMEGAFYYPTYGIGAIADRLAEYCGRENARTGSRISRILHDGNRIHTIEVNDAELLAADEVISTLPLDPFLRMLDPPPPEHVLMAAQKLRRRDLALAALFLKRKRITNAATVYFPDSNFPFTRVYEPKNRSQMMAPPDCTSLVAEIPCQEGDELWNLSDDRLVSLFRSKLVKIGWINENDVIGGAAVRLRHAYPILENGFEQNLMVVKQYLATFHNLRLSGRNALFQYSWIHNMLRYGKNVIAGLQTSTASERAVMK